MQLINMILAQIIAVFHKLQSYSSAKYLHVYWLRVVVIQRKNQGAAKLNMAAVTLKI